MGFEVGEKNERGLLREGKEERQNFWVMVREREKERKRGREKEREREREKKKKFE